MADKKVTKKEVITAMLKVESIVANADFKAYLENELALLEKRATNKKPTKVQEENEVLKTEVVGILGGSEKGMTVTEVMNASEVLGGLSNQKVTALMRALVTEGKVVKTVDGKKSIFSIA